MNIPFSCETSNLLFGVLPVAWGRYLLELHRRRACASTLNEKKNCMLMFR